jgi:hypothetical protein
MTHQDVVLGFDADVVQLLWGLPVAWYRLDMCGSTAVAAAQNIPVVSTPHTPADSVQEMHLMSALAPKLNLLSAADQSHHS